MCGANTSKAAAEAVMKAGVALVIIYVGIFFLVIQGASQNPVQAAPQSATALQDNNGAQTPAKPMDPVKDADIRSLMELLGVRDALQEATAKSTEQYRDSLLATVPDNTPGQPSINPSMHSYQNKFNPD